MLRVLTLANSGIMVSITVLGAGSWGSALAISLGQVHQVTLWGHNPSHLAQIEAARENTRYLPNIPLPSTLKTEPDLAKAVSASNIILCMTPTKSLPEIFPKIASFMSAQQSCFWGCKGFERGASTMIHELAARAGLPSDQVGVLSGPSFALEVAQQQPTALVAASQNIDLAAHLAEQISSATIRCYSSADVVGVEIGGAVKNVIAIAAGMADGLGYGANTRAALITRGLAEITRLGAALGAQPATLMGLAGMGDLLLTATDNQSRNRRFGLALGRGLSVDDAEAQVAQVVEGRYAVQGALMRARALKVDMPIAETLVSILEQKIAPRDAIMRLMQRPIKGE